MNIQSPFANLPPVIKNLLIINVILFIPYLMLNETAYGNYIISHLGVFYFDSPFFRPWQIITYMFVHGGWAHIIFNMFALFSFGPTVEYTMGSKRFFNFYFICGIGAIALQLIVQAFEVHQLISAFTVHGSTVTGLLPTTITKLQEIYDTPMVGASGAIFGVLVAFGMMYPNAELMLMFIPVPVKAKYVIPVYIVVEIYLGISQYAGDTVAHFAHLGGALIGFILVKAWRLHGQSNFF